MNRNTESGLAFDVLFRAEYTAVARTAYVILGDRERAKDITQEAFTRMYVSWRKVSRLDRPGAWVRRVAIRLAAREARRSALLATLLRRVEPSRDPSPTDPDIQAALRSLPHSQRAALALHYLEDLPVKEVAELLGCAESTAKVHLHRGRKKLAEVLGEEVSDVTR